MIARGDLAVECGHECLAEAQEEILWISEAAHDTVIGRHRHSNLWPRRAPLCVREITDATMGERGKCVILNKGPYVVEAVRTLDDILRCMQDHQEKKRSMLRNLASPPDSGAGGSAAPVRDRNVVPSAKR